MIRLNNKLIQQVLVGLICTTILAVGSYIIAHAAVADYSNYTQGYFTGATWLRNSGDAVLPPYQNTADAIPASVVNVDSFKNFLVQINGSAYIQN